MARILNDTELEKLIGAVIIDGDVASVSAPTTQVDAGYHGTLNWTLTNTSNDERRFLHGENLYRLTILKLEAGEDPVKFYEGDYQDQIGYVRSQRKGPPVGMRDNEWEDSFVEGGPEALLKNVIKSGYPWHLLGQRLKAIDQQFKIVSDEYGEIHDSLAKLNREMDRLSQQQNEASRTFPQMISAALKEETASLQNLWILVSGSLILALVGLILSFTSNQRALDFLKSNGAWIGVVLVVVSAIIIFTTMRRSATRHQSGKDD